MQLFIKTLTSIYPSFYIEVEIDDTILFLKAKIYETKNIPIEDQRILFAGRLLEDDKTFKDYNISKNEPFLVLRITKTIKNKVIG
jgi:hypothetical protein